MLSGRQGRSPRRLAARRRRCKIPDMRFQFPAPIQATCLAVVLSAAMVVGSTLAATQNMRRLTIWDLKLGEDVAAQPAPSEFRGFACGSNGGAPRPPPTRWGGFFRRPAPPTGVPA